MLSNVAIVLITACVLYVTYLRHKEVKVYHVYVAGQQSKNDALAAKIEAEMAEWRKKNGLQDHVH